MKALVWDHDLFIDDVQIPPIPEGWVLGRTLSASLSSIDRSIISGLHPGTPRRVLGSYGVVRVLEVGIHAEAEQGKIYGVVPYCQDKVIPLHIDGLMSEYSSIPSKCLRSMPSDADLGIAPLGLEVSFLNHLKEVVADTEKVLMIGCGFQGYIISSYLSSITDLIVSCPDAEKALMKEISGLGVKVLSIDKVLNEKFDAVIFNSTSTYYSIKAPRLLKDGGVLYLTPLLPSYVTTLTQIPGSFKVVWGKHTLIRQGMEAVSKLPKHLMNRYVRVTDELEEVPQLIRHFPRVIYVSSKK